MADLTLWQKATNLAAAGTGNNVRCLSAFRTSLHDQVCGRRGEEELADLKEVSSVSTLCSVTVPDL